VKLLKYPTFQSITVIAGMLLFVVFFIGLIIDLSSSKIPPANDAVSLTNRILTLDDEIISLKKELAKKDSIIQTFQEKISMTDKKSDEIVNRIVSDVVHPPNFIQPKINIIPCNSQLWEELSYYLAERFGITLPKSDIDISSY